MKAYPKTSKTIFIKNQRIFYGSHLHHSEFDCNTLAALWFCQTKESLKKFLASMVSKAGKLRSLVRDLKKNYSEAATKGFLDFQNAAIYNYRFEAEDPDRSIYLMTAVNECNFIKTEFTIPFHIAFSNLASKVVAFRCIGSLEQSITDIDKHYDSCNEAWAKGEVENFGTEPSLGLNMYFITN